MGDHCWESSRLFDSKSAALSDLLMLQSLISTNLANCAKQVYEE